MADLIYHGNDHVVELQSLKNAATDAAITSATVTADLQDSDGNSVTQGSPTTPFPITLSHVSGGTYRGTIPDTIDIELGGRYILVVLANAGSGLQGRWEVEIKVNRRGRE